MNSHDENVVIIGAGISGLSVATWLKQHGIRALVLERDQNPGGVMQSEYHAGYLVETGPNSLLETSPVIGELIELAGMQDEMVVADKAANKRYIVRNGRLHALPLNPIAFLRTPLFGTGAKLRLMREPFIKPLVSDEDESIASFVRRRLGNEFLDYAIDPFVAGVYAGDPEQLSVEAAFPKLKALETKYGSIIRGAIRGMKERAQRQEKGKNAARMLSFRQGLGQLAAGLSNKLGNQVRFGVSQVRLAPFVSGNTWEVSFRHEGELYQQLCDRVVVALSTDRLFAMTDGALAEACRPLQEIRYAPIGIVTTGYKHEQIEHQLDGFGYLVPKVERRRILGTLWNSSIFPERAPRGHALLTTFIGGARQPELALIPQKELIAITLEELEDLIGANGEPAFVHVRQYERAIPQYSLGHRRFQQVMDEVERNFPGLHFATNYRDGVSVSDCIQRAHRIAERVTSEVTGRTDIVGQRLESVS